MTTSPLSTNTLTKPTAACSEVNVRFYADIGIVVGCSAARLKPIIFAHYLIKTLVCSSSCVPRLTEGRKCVPDLGIISWVLLVERGKGEIAILGI